MRVRAVIEVVVVFLLTLASAAVVGVSAIGAWVRQVTGHAYLEYAVMIALPLACC